MLSCMLEKEACSCDVAVKHVAQRTAVGGCKTITYEWKLRLKPQNFLVSVSTTSKFARHISSLCVHIGYIFVKIQQILN